MKVIRRGQEMADEVRAARGEFTGDVDQRPLASVEHGAGVSLVRFTPGARTHWHTHSGGQVLHVIEGRGRVQAEAGEVVEIESGDLVVAEPGRRHWHGASESEGMTHISIAMGAIEWHEPA